MAFYFIVVCPTSSWCDAVRQARVRVLFNTRCYLTLVFCFMNNLHHFISHCFDSTWKHTQSVHLLASSSRQPTSVTSPRLRVSRSPAMSRRGSTMGYEGTLVCLTWFVAQKLSMSIPCTDVRSVPGRSESVCTVWSTKMQCSSQVVWERKLAENTSSQRQEQVCCV